FKKFFDHDIPIWLMLFPEGTRFREDKLKKTKKITEKKKLPPLQHVLLPRALKDETFLETELQKIYGQR
ncbi:MAG: hypothetical protein VXW15_03200, partial [Bdellovibrionota bacterium]|nr:hypothetical protein [Bdellovibrionota bacterium]